jgi:hypothetical protein
MTTISEHKAALVMATLLGGWHLVWSSLVALGLAQPLIDFAFWMHFIKPVYVIEPFNPGRAAILIAVTATVGYSVGYLFALLWNRLGGEEAF